MRTAIPILAVWLGLAASVSAVEIRDIQAAHGRFGPARSRLDVFPLEELTFRFTVAGLKPDADGRVSHEVATTLTDASGRELFNDRANHTAELLQGGETVAAAAGVAIGSSAAPGTYTLTIRVTDRSGGGSAQFVRKLNCLAAEFRLINPRFYHDAARTSPAAAAGLVGQTLHLRVQAASPEWRDGRSAVSLRLDVCDPDGRIVSRRPVTVRREVDRGGPYRALAVDADLSLPQAGEFLIRLTLLDEVARKESTLTLPLTVGRP